MLCAREEFSRVVYRNRTTTVDREKKMDEREKMGPCAIELLVCERKKNAGNRTEWKSSNGGEGDEIFKLFKSFIVYVRFAACIHFAAILRRDVRASRFKRGGGIFSFLC